VGQHHCPASRPRTPAFLEAASQRTRHEGILKAAAAGGRTMPALGHPAPARVAGPPANAQPSPRKPAAASLPAQVSLAQGRLENQGEAGRPISLAKQVSCQSVGSSASSLTTWASLGTAKQARYIMSMPSDGARGEIV